ncbi:MerR family transcriptional regulator [Nonomuraea sp. NPDC001831]|uniref:MerR family transcriptional regulator n=1 Tax=Nonomuraea sp. NPDC001831 TaxID=3364340 RepID=UPI0036B219A2
MDEELLPIGQFARLGRLSVKQLRHYDELGLLRPAYVDAVTGYRYYRAGQAREALSIALLRSLDVPLAVVGQVLSGEVGALESVRVSLEVELARRRRTLASLERVLASGLPAAEVSVVRECGVRAAFVGERAAGMEDVGRATSAAVARLVAGLPEGFGPVRLVGLFPVDVGEVVDVRVALLLEDGVEDGVEVGGGFEVGVLPGGVFARATHVGPYDQIALTVHAVLAWCAERRLVVRGAVREVYVSDPGCTPPGELVTDVLVPVVDGVS